ncbi:MAG: lamin tail domain-containing protein [Kofleriaceae bacterium]|nr:lamin tail domain-containing protein [Kofleriaceae bacterium]
MRLIGSSVVVAGAFAVATAAGCTRDPAPAECPDVAVGDLVVTEFRGPQSPDDALGTWVELYNASGASIDLEGTKLRFRKKDGSSEVPVIVRRSLPVAAGAYVVLGLVPDDATRPSHIDYGFSSDFHVGFLAAAAVDVEACGERIDRATYDVLPKTGTYSLGVTPPTADANDVPANWCTNATSEGTPKQANPTCP